MRILFLLRSSIFNRIGGAEIQAYYLCRELTKYGHEVHYIFDSNERGRIKGDNVTYHFLHDYGSLFCWFNFFSLGKLIRKINPDIIYQAVAFAYTGIAANHAKKNSIKMVHTVTSDEECIKHKISISKAFIPNLINEHGARYGIKNADEITVFTEYQRNLIRKSFNRDGIVIPVGHPVPSPPFEKIDSPIIIWVASIKKLKQPEIFIKLAEECQDLNAQFVYCGRPAEREYQKMLMYKTNKLPNLEYLGKISFNKLYKLLANASILVNTSVYEGFPVTYVEAWMRETPVVTLNCDPDDIIKNKKIGFHSGSFEQLVKDVRYLIENENIRKGMGKKAREYAVEEHDFEKVGRKYLEVFNKLMEE